MGSEIKRPSPKPDNRCFTSEPLAPTRIDRELVINVVFTTATGTLAALRAAQDMAGDLNAQCVLLVPQIVPLQFSFSSPPVSIEFTERRAHPLALECRGNLEISIRVYLCGDTRKCLLKALKPQSIILLGGRRRWGLAREQRMARLLQANGHRVIFVDED